MELLKEKRIYKYNEEKTNLEYSNKSNEIIYIELEQKLEALKEKYKDIFYHKKVNSDY